MALDVSSNAMASPEAINQLVERILSTEPTLKDWSKLEHFLSKANLQLLVATTADSQDPLTILDPVVNTLGYIYFLVARIQVLQNEPPLGLLEAVKNIITAGDAEQMCLVPEKVYEIAFYYAEWSRSQKQPILALDSLRQALIKITPSPHTLSVMHQLYIRQCLLAQAYPDAVKVLDYEIRTFEPHITRIHYQDHLLYHYYGGMVWCALKKFDKALQFFEIVLMAPSNAVSAIQIEAYKKYILSSLLCNGKLRQPPKSVSGFVMRSAKTLCSSYLHYADTFAKGDVAALQSDLNACLREFEADLNAGLAKQCIDARMRENIKDLSQIYVTLSLSDIAKKLGSHGEEGVRLVEQYLVRMVKNHEIFAKIEINNSTTDGFVTFYDDPETYNGPDTVEKINANIEDVIKLMERTAVLDAEIEKSKDYITKLNSAERERGGSRSDVWLGSGEDFDMMEDTDEMFT